MYNDRSGQAGLDACPRTDSLPFLGARETNNHEHTVVLQTAEYAEAEPISDIDDSTLP